MNKKTIVSASGDTVQKPKVLAKKKEDVRRKLVVTAKKKERVRRKLVVTAKQLAVIAKEKESIRRKLVVTAQEKERVRNKLVITAKQLAVAAREKESIRRKLVVTAEEKERVRNKLKILAKEKERVRNELVVTAEEKERVRNKLVITAKQLAVAAREKERVRRKLAVTAEELNLKAKNLAVIAKEKESIRRKLVVTAEEKESIRRKLVVTAEEKERVRNELKVLAKEKEDVRRKLVVTAEEKERVRNELKVLAKEKEDVRRKLAVTAEELKGSDKILKEKILAVEEAIAKNEAIITSIGDGLIATDNNGRIILVNKAFENILGWNGNEVQMKLLLEVVPMIDENGKLIPESERPINIIIKEQIKTTTTTTNHYYKRKNGTSFPVVITTSPILLKSKFIGVVEVFRDITKEKAIDKAKTEFVSLASHQLRTPLTTVSWYTEMILRGDVGQVIPDQKKYLEEIYQGNQRMIKLVNTLLDVSRIELGTFMIDPRPTDIIALAQSVLNEQKLEIEQKKLVIIQKFGKDVPIFQTDPKLLGAVFQNLLTNAVKYTPPGGTIEFIISSDDKTILIKVSDTGYGIPKNQQDQIFTKLFRADNVKDKDTGGTGLGLYITKSIVENSGGKIWFESEEDKGTSFSVTFPKEGMKKKEGANSLI